MAIIYLVSGGVTLVDDRDVDAFCYRWYLLKCGKLKYARTTIDRKHVLLHRFILRPHHGLDVDHINGDGLDNRSQNLRVVTHAVNLWNRHNGLEHDGVSYSSKNDKWRVTIGHYGTQVDGGFYDDEATALVARAYLSHKLRGTECPAMFDPLTLPPTARRFLLANAERQD